jgi:hypothetical protein
MVIDMNPRRELLSKNRWLAFSLITLFAGVTFTLAQRWGRWSGEGWLDNADTIRTAREAPSHSNETPMWTNSPAFPKDVFTFARVRYHRSAYGSRTAGEWHTDFPDSDLNLSFRLQELTSIKVDPNGRVIDITDKELLDYPWIYMVEPGRLMLEDDEVPVLRKYLLNGGFLMADDFWGEVQWENFATEMKRVLPECNWVDLPMTHPIFKTVFPLNYPKSKMQVPNVMQGIRSQYDGVTWEYHDGEECNEVHFRALFDTKGRMIAIACHNTDNGDGWERESEDNYFFRNFSEKISYPLAINIVFYAMTH